MILLANCERAICGFTGSEISQRLNLSPKTITTYRSRICEKLQLKSRAEIVSYAITAGLLAAEA